MDTLACVRACTRMSHWVWPQASLINKIRNEGRVLRYTINIFITFHLAPIWLHDPAHIITVHAQPSPYATTSPKYPECNHILAASRKRDREKSETVMSKYKGMAKNITNAEPAVCGRYELRHIQRPMLLFKGMNRSAYKSTRPTEFPGTHTYTYVYILICGRSTQHPHHTGPSHVTSNGHACNRPRPAPYTVAHHRPVTNHVKLATVMPTMVNMNPRARFSLSDSAALHVPQTHPLASAV